MWIRPAVVVLSFAVAGCAVRSPRPDSPGAYVAQASAPSWNYPESSNWPAACRTGQQSPVYLNQVQPTPVGNYYVVTQATLDPDDRNVVFMPTPGPAVAMEPDSRDRRDVYTPIGFHFHNGAEHILAGGGTLEMHIKTTDADGKTAVFATLWRAGGSSGDPTLAAAAEALGSSSDAPEAVDLGPVLRRFTDPAKSFFSYVGSLTTPPCTGGIRWFVLAQPVEASSESIDRLRNALVAAGVSRTNVRDPRAPPAAVFLFTPKNPRP